DIWGKSFAVSSPPCSFVADLRDRVGLVPGDSFRGTVATFTGFRNRVSGAGWADMHNDDAVLFQKLGSEVRATGLWHHGIPTLHEYNQMMTPTYYFMTSRILARPQDVQRRSVVVLTHPDIPYLRSLGIRLIVTDQPVHERSATLCRTEHLGEERCLYVYEL